MNMSEGTLSQQSDVYHQACRLASLTEDRAPDQSMRKPEMSLRRHHKLF